MQHQTSLETLGRLFQQNIAGALAAALFFGASLSPSLMPRGTLEQGVLAGACAAIGFGFGILLRKLWVFLELPVAADPLLSRLRRLGYAAAGVIVLAALWFSADWQNITRAAIGLDPVETAYPFWISVAAIATLAFIFVVFVFLCAGWAFVDSWLKRVITGRARLVLTFLLFGWLIWAIFDGFLIQTAFRIANETYRTADSFIEPSIAPPTSPLRTGSAASLVGWKQLGRRGREYISRTPTREEISEFVPDGAMEPIRVYVGLNAAETSKARAELALRELLRVGAFERSVLVLMVPVGTGWMDPGGQDTMEFMLGGDVATVAVQYSYLRGAWSILADSERGREQGQALFDAVYSRWRRLPKQDRPRLYLHGLSQGAFISQQTLSLADMLDDPINGALWVGSPFFSPLWRRIRENRQPESPAWRPAYGNSSLARSGNQHGGFDLPDRPWGPIRLAFLNYGSDPIVVFDYASAYRQPDWMSAPRAPDVASELRWFPIVTMLQIALDTSVSLNVPGYGHYYIAPHYIDAWAAVLAPSGWNAEKSKLLKDIFLRRPPPF